MEEQEVQGRSGMRGRLEKPAAGWLGSSWRQPASPQRESLGSGGVALRASTPATPWCNLLLNH
ncbi:MAG: hypothetical protein ACLP53_29820, partial [Isosphaeraceae bacterium]